MSRPFKPVQPRARFVVQVKTDLSRESFPAASAQQALAMAERYAAAGNQVQVFSEAEGFLEIDELRTLVSSRLGQSRA